MKWHDLTSIIMLMVASSTFAFATNRNVIRLPVQVQDLNDQAIIMQQSLDEDLDWLSESLQQSAAQLVASETKLERMQQAVQERSARTGSAALDLQQAALAKSSNDAGVQLHNIERQVQTLGAEIGLPTEAAVAAGQAPPPDVLFRIGMEDYEAGRYKLAGQEFGRIR
jgi:hypothetical protein